MPDSTCSRIHVCIFCFVRNLQTLSHFEQWIVIKTVSVYIFLRIINIYDFLFLGSTSCCQCRILVPPVGTDNRYLISQCGSNFPISFYMLTAFAWKRTEEDGIQFFLRWGEAASSDDYIRSIFLLFLLLDIGGKLCWLVKLSSWQRGKARRQRNWNQARVPGSGRHNFILETKSEGGK